MIVDVMHPFAHAVPLAQFSYALPLAQTDNEAARSGFWQIVFSGGAVGVAILVVLVGLSIASAYLVFDQVMTLRRREILPDGLSESVRQRLGRGSVAEATAVCQESPSVLAYAILSGLAEVDAHWQGIEKAVEDAMAEQAARLMRRIEYLSVIGNIAPMVGLLGTVTGMIFAFQQVAASQGTAGAGDLAEGIYQALVTTVGGLIVAIPSLGAFAILRNRVDALMAEVAHQASHALTPIKRRGTRPAAGRAPFQNPPGKAGQ
jgi:biopolymer transport protein ExbB